jgi:hypothetical protein
MYKMYYCVYNVDYGSAEIISGIAIFKQDVINVICILISWHLLKFHTNGQLSTRLYDKGYLYVV